MSKLSILPALLASCLLSAHVVLAEETLKAPDSIAAAKSEWKVLCDGKSLKDWRKASFGGEGSVDVEDGAIVMQQGSDLTGIQWTGAQLPRINYEVVLDAKRLQGTDFFSGIVFPIGDSYCSFVVGAWGGGVVGLSSIDNQFADRNETTLDSSFDDKRWYQIRLRVSETYLQGWIDDKRVFCVKTAGKKFTVHPAVETLKPFGVSCYATVAAIKNIRLRELTKEELAEVPQAMPKSK